MNTTSPAEPDRLLTFAECARRLGLSRRAFLTRRALNHFPVIDLGGRIRRVRQQDLEAYVLARRSEPRA
jgi:hypothetical protein